MHKVTTYTETLASIKNAISSITRNIDLVEVTPYSVEVDIQKKRNAVFFMLDNIKVLATEQQDNDMVFNLNAELKINVLGNNSEDITATSLAIYSFFDEVITQYLNDNLIVNKKSNLENISGLSASRQAVTGWSCTFDINLILKSDIVTIDEQKTAELTVEFITGT